MKKAEYEKLVVDSLVALLKEGGLEEWSKSWSDNSGATGFFPENFSTKKQYGGQNVFVLLATAYKQKFVSNCWLTFNQVRKLGGTVKKGSKSTPILFYKLIDTLDDDGVVRQIPLPRWSRVFNLDQTDGLLNVSQSDTTTGESRPLMNSYLLNFIETMKIGYSRGSHVPFYSLNDDAIAMPQTFDTDDDYLVTLAHEVIHSTGHKDRCNRDLSLESYAKEELVAEIGSMLLGAKFGVVGSHLQHESYIDHWFSKLDRNFDVIYKASSLASKAVSYISEQVSDTTN